MKNFTVYALRKFIETVIKVRFDAPTHGDDWCVGKETKFKLKFLGKEY